VTLTLAIVLTVLTHVAFVGSRMTIALYGIQLGATPLTVAAVVTAVAVITIPSASTVLDKMSIVTAAAQLAGRITYASIAL